MIRKLRVSFWPAEHLEAAVFLHHLLIIEDGMDGVWGEIEDKTGQLLEKTWDETRELEAVLEALGKTRAVEVYDNDRETLTVAFGIPAADVRIDLVDMLGDDERGREAAREVIRLCQLVGSVEGFEVNVKVGGRGAVLSEVVELIMERVLREGPAFAATGSFGEAPRGFGLEFIQATNLDWPVSIDELRKAFRRCAFRYHPDRNHQNPVARDRFVVLAQGYEELMQLL